MQVMEVGDEAAGDDLLFHHHRRASAEDRDLDERTKRALTEQDWPDMNAHAEARRHDDIKERARSANLWPVTTGVHDSR